MKIAGGSLSHVCQQPPLALAADAQASIRRKPCEDRENHDGARGLSRSLAPRRSSPSLYSPLHLLNSQVHWAIGSDFLRRHACVGICMCTATEPRQAGVGRGDAGQRDGKRMMHIVVSSHARKR